MSKKINKPTKGYLAEIEKAASEKGVQPLFTIMRTGVLNKKFPADHMIIICYDKSAETHWKKMISVMAAATVITPAESFPKLKKKKSRK